MKTLRPVDTMRPRQVRLRPSPSTALSELPKPPRKPLAWRMWLRRFLLLTGFMASVWIVLFSHWLDIRGIELKNNATISTQSMNTLVDEYLAANPVQKNILFTDTASLAEAIEKRQPTLSNLTIQRTFLLKLRLTVRETTPLLIWQSGNDLWLLGEDGRILAPAKAGERGLGLIVDTAQITVKPGDKVSDAVFVGFTRTIISEMKRRNIELETAYIESTTRELKLRLKSGVVVRTDTSRGPGEQLDAYQATVQTSQRTKEPITEYIDVRIPGKTFYK